MGKAMKSYADYRLRKNNQDYLYYFKKYKRLVTNMFKWEGLPKGSERFIEQVMFSNGKAVLFKNKMGFLQIAKVSNIGLNDYNEATQFQIDSMTNHETLKIDECVPLYNNSEREPSCFDVEYFARKMQDIEKTIDVNLRQLKKPILVICPEGQKETIKVLLQKQENGEVFIPVSDDFQGVNNFLPLDMKTKNYTMELAEYRQLREKEFYNYFGINCVDVVKKERLTSSEAEQNDEQISIMKKSMLEQRELFCKNANKMFGCNISVRVADVNGNDNDNDNVNVNGNDNVYYRGDDYVGR